MHSPVSNKPKVPGVSLEQLPAFVSALDETIISHLTQRRLEAEAISADYGRMWSYIELIYSAGGKRLRPFLAYASLNTLSENAHELSGFMDTAAAIEYIHMAMLVHDDIIDNDYVRHGQPNISGLYSETYHAVLPSSEVKHAANAAAMLAGDALISEAYRLIAASTLEPTYKDQICAAFGEAIFAVIGGELLDLEAENHDPESVDSYRIAQLKTASYTCVMPLSIGAILADSTHETVSEMATIGTAIGVAFQMVDDELGVFGDEAHTGKSASNDLREGKRTMLLQMALGMASARQRQELLDILSQKSLSDAAITACRTIIEQSGARAKHAEQYQKYMQQAMDGIGRLPIGTDAAQNFEQLLQSLVKRAA